MLLVKTWLSLRWSIQKKQLCLICLRWSWWWWQKYKVLRLTMMKMVIMMRENVLKGLLPLSSTWWSLISSVAHSWDDDGHLQHDPGGRHLLLCRQECFERNTPWKHTALQVIIQWNHSDHSTNWPTVQLTKQPTKKQQTHKPRNQQINKSTNQQTNKPTN